MTRLSSAQWRRLALAVPGLAWACLAHAPLFAEAAQPLKAVLVAPDVWFVEGETALGSAANRNFISNAGFIPLDHHAARALR